MEKRFYKPLLVIIVLANTLFACTKKEFNFKDGYPADSLTINKSTEGPGEQDAGLLEYAKIFPGVTGSSEPRVQNAGVTLNLDFESQNIYGQRILGGDLTSTGMYAPVGETVTIVVPQGVVGLTCQIGIWNQHVDGGARYPFIVSFQQLVPGINTVRNIFGGHIYITPTYPANSVTLTFSGSYASPDFVLGVTNAASWRQAIQTSQVPWFEIRTKKLIFTLPVAKMRTYLQNHPEFDIANLATVWDATISADFVQWAGLVENGSNPLTRAWQTPFRVAMDAQLQYATDNTTTVFIANIEEWMEKLMAITDASAAGVVTNWDILGLLGFRYANDNFRNINNNLFWGDLPASVEKLFNFKRANRLGITDRTILSKVGFNTTVVNAALDFSGAPVLDLATGVAKNFNGAAILSDRLGLAKMVPFLQIFDKLKGKNGEDGIDFFPYLNQKYLTNRANITFINDLARQEFMYEALCEFTGMNCILFFQAWGIAISPGKETAMAALYPNKLVKNIWQYNPITRTGGDQTVTSLPGQIYPRTAWTITGSTEEPNEPRPGLGRFIDAIDGKPETFWHTKWNGGGPDYPHFLVIDMHAVNLVSALNMLPRQGSDGPHIPRHFKVYIGNSSEINEMTLAFEGDFVNDRKAQTFVFTTPVSGRYMRLVFETGWNSQFANIAEIYAL